MAHILKYNTNYFRFLMKFDSVSAFFIYQVEFNFKHNSIINLFYNRFMLLIQGLYRFTNKIAFIMHA